jgi:hypothetical protein
MARPGFASRFHPTFLSTSYEGEASLILSLSLSLTFLLGVAHRARHPIKTHLTISVSVPPQ